MINILHFDKDIIVCEKPTGILSQADSSGGKNLPDELKKQTNSYYVEAVHRLDRPVGGVMVYARNKTAAGKLSADVASKKFDKEYLAVVSGKPEAESGEYTDYLFKDTAHCRSYAVKTLRKGAKEAKLSYKVLGTAEYEGNTLTLVSVRLFTGRTHQIRVQFSSRGMPLAGDGKYGSKINCDLALRSHEISFTHPRTGERMTFSSEPPAKFPWTLNWRTDK